MPYLVVATGQSRALSSANIAAWVLVAPAAKEHHAAWLLLLSDLSGNLMPRAPLDVAVQALRSYLAAIGSSSDPAHAQWALDLLDSVPETDHHATVRACQDVAYLFGLICLTQAIPEPKQGDFVSIGDSDRSKPSGKWRVDWRNPSSSVAGESIAGAHGLGAALLGRRRIFIEKTDGIRSISSLDELLEVLELARRAVGTEIWEAPLEVRDEFAAHLARLSLVRRLLRRYFTGQLVQINNNAILTRLGFSAAHLLGAEIAYNDAFISPRPPSAQAPDFADELDSLTLNSSQASSLQSAIYESTGAKLRTCLDAGSELHLYYKTTAMSRRELLHEFLHILALLPGIADGKAIYALSAFTSETAAGTRGEIDGPAYTSELATAWAWGESARQLADRADARLVWHSVALTRWRYDEGNIYTKSLGLLDLPYIT